MSTQTKRCVGPECDRPAVAVKLQMCYAHRNQHYRNGRLTVVKPVNTRRGLKELGPCVGPECGRIAEVSRWQLCRPHHKQFMRRDQDMTRLQPLQAPRGIHGPRRQGATCVNHPEAKVYGRGMCVSCYRAERQAAKREGFDAGPRLCGFDGCGRIHHANGWCSTHNQQAAAGNGMWPIGRKPAPAKGTPSPKRGKPRRGGESKNLPDGWFRKTKPAKKEAAATDPTGQFAIVDFLIPTLPDKIIDQARANALAMGADDLLDMLGLEAS